MDVARTKARQDERTAGSGLATLYEEHAPAGMRLAYLLTGEQAAAEDLVHEAFVRVMGRTLRTDDSYVFKAYLRRTIINRHTSHLRRRKVERAYLDRERGRAVPQPETPDFEGRQEMWHRLLALPARQRAAIVLHYYEDLSEAETAQALGCSRSAVKALVFRALSALREDMKEETSDG